MIYYREKPLNLNKKMEREFALQLLEDALKEEYGIHTLPLILCSELGKPFFPDYPNIHFNYSHSKNYVACGISDQEIGVDIEDVRKVKDSLIRTICHENEYQWIIQAESEEDRYNRIILLWTIKEAYLKQRGTGINCRLNTFDFSSLLYQNGEGIYEDKYIKVKKIDSSYLCFCALSEYNILHI